jgi:hypothetical protein
MVEKVTLCPTSALETLASGGVALGSEYTVNVSVPEPLTNPFESVTVTEIV